MKCVLVALFAVVAVASAGIYAPTAWSGLGYTSAWGATPYASAWATPYAVPTVARTVVAAPAIQSGYVAATRGSVHTAPLPEGPHAFSHHLNLAPAPGTW